jgi:molybdenum cofactor guanylyltransferase
MNGLVLAGGLSTRMGTDKGLLVYHEKPQREYLFEILSKFCKEVFVSINPHQHTELPFIVDTSEISSPLVGILSAFEQNPDVAWLVVACDMPLIDYEIIHFLVKNRDEKTLATAFRNPEENFPEPLITIYESDIYPKLKQAFSENKKSARRVLENSAITLLEIPNSFYLTNINTEEKAKEFKQLQGNKL